jgi:hypothetical protein
VEQQAARLTAACHAQASQDLGCGRLLRHTAAAQPQLQMWM